MNNNGYANYDAASFESGVRPDFTSVHYGQDSLHGNGKGKAIRSGDDPPDE